MVTFPGSKMQSWYRHLLSVPLNSTLSQNEIIIRIYKTQICIIWHRKPTLWLVMTSLRTNQSTGAMASSSGRRLSSPRWRRVCLGCICIAFLHTCAQMNASWLHRIKTKGSGAGATLHSCITTPDTDRSGSEGNDEAEVVSGVCMLLSRAHQSVKSQWEDLMLPGVKGLEGCVCLCYQSPAAKSY